MDQNLRSVLPVVIKTWDQDLRPTFFFPNYSLIINIMEKYTYNISKTYLSFCVHFIYAHLKQYIFTDKINPVY